MPCELGKVSLRLVCHDHSSRCVHKEVELRTKPSPREVRSDNDAPLWTNENIEVCQNFRNFTRGLDPGYVFWEHCKRLSKI